MAHEILGKRFISRAVPAWHGLAQRIFPEDAVISAGEAMAEVAGDVDVTQAPIYYELDGVRTRIEKSTAIVRRPLPDSPAPVVLGITSEAWVAASYAELARALDELSRTYKVETAGVLKDGGLAFLSFRGDNYSVRGDEMRNYFTANLSLTPGIGHKVLQSDVRVVCWNTNLRAEQNASINLGIRHASDAVQRIELAARLVSTFQETKERAKAIFEAFADFHVTQAEAEGIFRAAFPAPPLPAKLRLIKSKLTELESEQFRRALTPDLLDSLVTAEEAHERAKDQVERLIQTTRERFEAFEPSRLGGTAWAAYNAVTEVADWREGRGAEQSAVLGSRAQEKTRAYAAALQLVNA